MTLIAYMFALMALASAGKTARCPVGCSCQQTSFGSQLTIDCSQSPDIDASQLYRQLDSFLTARHIVQNLTSLNITKSSLKYVPPSICQLLKLTSLSLDRNKLIQLPDNCLTKLTKLVTFSAVMNAIVGLQNGLFDGLQSLNTLDLSGNQIDFIGLRVFSNASDLTSLRLVKLDFNKLTSLEPWWYSRCIHGSESSPVTISLVFNMITNFTNEMQFDFRCGMKKAYGELDLSENRIAHIMDIFRGWNVDTFATQLCLYNSRGGRPYMKFILDGESYVCDCVDFWFYKVSKAIPNDHWLRHVRCGANFYGTTGQKAYAISIPLNEFVCKLSERCPPGCECAYRPENATVHVYCSSANLSSLPLDLPPVPKNYVKYKLDFSNNKLLRRLEHRPYYVNTSILDVSNCSLTEIGPELLEGVSHMKFANLRDNMLQSFPRLADNETISTGFALGGNLWRCSCDNSWMIHWLQSLSNQISDPGDIICGTPPRMYGRNVLKSTEEDFCHVSPTNRTLAITFSTVASASSVLVITGLLFYKLRVKFYRRWKFHPFDRDECLGEDMDYDVFLCCSSEDHDNHARIILELLESNGYRVYYHEREFRPGLIADNVVQSVEHSKRTLCLLSTNFLQSNMCLHEFDVAYHHNVVERRNKRLIVLMMLDNPADLYAGDASNNATLRQYIRQYTYIDYRAQDWRDKLLYAMPLRGLLQRNPDTDHDVLVLQDIHMG